MPITRKKIKDLLSGSVVVNEKTDSSGFRLVQKETNKRKRPLSPKKNIEGKNNRSPESRTEIAKTSNKGESVPREIYFQMLDLRQTEEENIEDNVISKADEYKCLQTNKPKMKHKMVTSQTSSSLANPTEVSDVKKRLTRKQQQRRKRKRVVLNKLKIPKRKKTLLDHNQVTNSICKQKLKRRKEAEIKNISESLTKSPDSDVFSEKRRQGNSEIVEESNDADKSAKICLDKVPKIIIHRNFSLENLQNLENIKRIVISRSDSPIDSHNSVTTVHNDSKTEKHSEFERNHSNSNECALDEKYNVRNTIERILNNGNTTFNSDIESSETTSIAFSNSTTVSDCGQCSKNENEKEQPIRNPFFEYRLEANDLNIKITRPVNNKVLAPHISSMFNFNSSLEDNKNTFRKRKYWTECFDLEFEPERITSRDSIFENALIEDEGSITSSSSNTQGKFEDSFYTLEKSLEPTVVNLQNTAEHFNNKIHLDNTTYLQNMTYLDNNRCLPNTTHLENVPHFYNNIRLDDMFCSQSSRHLDNSPCLQNPTHIDNSPVQNVDQTKRKLSNDFFAAPILPPAKRPPTRWKSTSTSNLSPPKPSKHLSSSSYAEDDAISLFASSTICSPKSDHNDPDEIEERNAYSKLLEQNYFHEQIENAFRDNLEADCNEQNDSNLDILEKEDTEKVLANETDSSTVEEVDSPSIKKTSLILKQAGPRPFIPRIFRALCYFHFTDKKCKLNRCVKSHTVHSSFENRILELPFDKLQEAYNYTIGKYLYKDTFAFFVKAFSKYNNVLYLVNLIKDIVQQDRFERSPFIETIVTTIRKMGYSFYETMEEIITILGIANLRNQNICLSDILLNIIVRFSTNLEKDWPLIQKLTKYRVETLDHGVVEDIIRFCVKSKSSKLCLNVFQGILKTNIVNLRNLNTEVLISFICILRSLSLYEIAGYILRKAGIAEEDILPPLQHMEENFFNNIPNGMSQTLENNHVPTTSKTPESNTGLKRLSESKAFTNKQDNFKSYGITPLRFERTPSFQESYDSQSLQNPLEFSSDSSDSELQEEESYSSGVCFSPGVDLFVENVRSRFDESESGISKHEISQMSIVTLTRAIKGNDVSKFLGVLERFKAEEYMESFVMQVIYLWQKESLNEVYKMICRIFNTILNEKNKDRFWYDPQARSLIETLALNVVALFHTSKSWRQAANIIRKFSKDYANLVKAKCYRFHKYAYSELGKYLYFCKLFIRAGYLQDTYDLLMNPDLKLLLSHNLWTLPHQKAFDSEFRNDVVQEFLKKAFLTEITLAKNIILRIIRDQDCIINIDIWRFYNELVISLMDQEQTKDLLDMLDYILDGWHCKLKKESFRGLLITLLKQPQVEPIKIKDLYVHACRHGFYKNYDGTENEIQLKTDMLYEELYLILHIFFFKKAAQEIPEYEDLCIKLQLPETVDDRPKLLLNSNVSMIDFRNKVYRILASGLYHPVCIEESDDGHLIRISEWQLSKVLRFYKNRDYFSL